MVNLPPCAYCEMAFIDFETDRALTDPLEAPNTYDRANRCYRWVDAHAIKYLLVPRSLDRSTVHAELYLCLDEDDIRDLNLSDFLRTLVEQEILPRWPTFRLVDVIPALVSAKPEAPCWRLEEGDANGSEEKH